MIRDLESQLLRVQNASTKDFLEEAIRCYHMGANRAAVVQAMAAGIHDLFNKITDLVASGAAPASLRATFATIEQKFKNQESYERDLLKVAQKEATIISPAELKLLDSLFDIRNLCAHPSGHAGSPEEARHVINAVVDLIASRPGELGMSGVEDIIQRLAGPTFFPKSDMTTLSKIARQEIQAIHRSLYAALVSRLIDLILQWLAAASGGTTTNHESFENAARFLRGMTNIGDEELGFVWNCKKIPTLICHPDATEVVLDLLAANVDAIRKVDGLTKSRLLQIVGQNLDCESARSVTRDLVAGTAIDEDEREDLFKSAIAAFLESITERNYDEVVEIGWPRLTKAFLEKIVERCASGTWDIANPAIHLVQKIPQVEAQCLDRETLAKYALNVASVGLGQFKSKQAFALVTDGLGPRIDAIDALIEWVTDEPETVFACRTDWEAVVMLLDSSERNDSILTIFSAMGLHMKTPSSVFKYLENHHNSELASLGADLRAKAKEFEED